MSDVHPAYIRCASGSNSHTDCVVRRFGDLVEIMGHPLMHLTPDDAVHFATAVLHAAGKTGHGGTDETTARIRSEIAMALHAPVMADSLSRPLLMEASEALAYQEREATYWRREWQASEEMYWAESSDGK
jgi:hypothetical protein